MLRLSHRPMQLDAQEAQRVRKHRLWVGLGETLAAQHLEKHLYAAPGHVGIGHALAARNRNSASRRLAARASRG
jgi:hypothetical protein